METKIITIKICAGTHCYLMGGAELQLFQEYLPHNIRHKVKVTGSPCLEACNCKDSGRPPFVVVDDTIVEQANVHTLLDIVKTKLDI